LFRLILFQLMLFALGSHDCPLSKRKGERL